VAQKESLKTLNRYIVTSPDRFTIHGSQFTRPIWRIADLIVGGIFIYAGVLKMLDPVRFASDIDNYKILPWTIGVALAFYLPWLEIFCGVAVVLRFLYGGALSILTALILFFTLATVAVKVRGLDITCGCFGHASQHWSFPAHLIFDLLLLLATFALSVRAYRAERS
jgi:putative oxidoreductase